MRLQSRYAWSRDRVLLLAHHFAGFPLASHLLSHKQTTQGGFNLGGINATGQLPAIPGNRGLIDVDTPQEAYTKQSYTSGETLQLVFSDEFNVEGRSFYAGDDPYWEAPNIHYWGTVSVGRGCVGSTGLMCWFDRVIWSGTILRR